MFHLSEIFAVWPGKQLEPGDTRDSKSVGLRDLMIIAGQRMGVVQALGVDVHYPLLLHLLRQRLTSYRLGRTWAAREIARLPARIASQALGTGKLFVGILEDFPDQQNRVMFDPASPSKIIVKYSIPDELKARSATFRRSLKNAFRGLKPVFVNRTPEPNWGHSCGTTRMGSTPSNSVVDPSCRVHGLDNLWITDAGVFPSSMGVNPSLTIAANALRVANLITTDTLSM
jgi:choline dehydrogenase-like flavoprotein